MLYVVKIYSNKCLLVIYRMCCIFCWLLGLIVLVEVMVYEYLEIIGIKVESIEWFGKDSVLIVCYIIFGFWGEYSIVGIVKGLMVYLSG